MVTQPQKIPLAEHTGWCGQKLNFLINLLLFIQLSIAISPSCFADYSLGVTRGCNAQEGTMGIACFSVTKSWFPNTPRPYEDTCHQKDCKRGSLMSS